jgi:hypothetical protein
LNFERAGDSRGGASSASRASSDWMQGTTWKEARAVDREKIWKYLLGGFP